VTNGQLSKKAPSQVRPLLAIAFYSFKALIRNRATVFFGIAFPLFFITAFGLIGNNALSISIGVPTSDQKGAVYQALSSIQVVSIKSGTRQDLLEKLSQGGISAVLTADKGQTELFVSQSNPQNAAAAEGLVNGVVDKLNLQLSGVKKPRVVVNLREVSGRSYKYIDFFLPGMIGFALLTTSVTSIAFGLIFLKKALVLKRLFATPIRSYTILFGQGLARLLFVLIQTLVIVFVGVVAFKFTLIHGALTLFYILILSVIGLVSFLGFGIFVAGVANDENTVAPVANLIVLPQFLVAGTFFPVDALPAWLQPEVKVLPLAFFNTAIRKVTVEGLGFGHLLPQLAGLAVWAILAYFLASRTFRWE